MHTCPICGMDCDCSGDLDDASVMTERWVSRYCQCDHEGSGLEAEGMSLEDEGWIPDLDKTDDWA